EPKALENEIDFVLQNAGKYLLPSPTSDDILSVFAGIRPLVKSASKGNTAAFSRGHFIKTDASGLITITGGKWTTYRRMAEDGVDHAIKTGGLRDEKSKTAELTIHSDSKVNEDDLKKLTRNLPYYESDIRRAIKTEMARTVEDVLARRTR